MNIGIIALNQEEGKMIKSLLSRDHKYYVFTRPHDPDGFQLDAVIETAQAKDNKHYSIIKDSASYCTMRE